jgi:uncharacterized protein involved in exopolysaccharide biosynthesis
MSEAKSGEFESSGEDDIRLIRIFSVLLLWKLPIIIAAISGLLLGVSYAYLQPKYESSSVFIPQTGDALSSSALALAASQLGIRSAGSSGNWTPAIYADIVASRSFLERIALDTLTVEELGDQRVSVMELLKIPNLSPDRRKIRAVRELEDIVEAIEDKKLGVVRLTASTRWPSVSRAIVQRLISYVNAFNLKTRQSQASAERKHIESQVALASTKLREAEEVLRQFLERNRQTSESPGLTFERDRFQREVTLRQTLYSTLMQQLEDARIREVRETPVITVLQEPSMPVAGENRGILRWGVVGAAACVGIVTMLLALARYWKHNVWEDNSADSLAFTEELRRIFPFLRRTPGV